MILKDECIKRIALARMERDAKREEKLKRKYKVYQLSNYEFNEVNKLVSKYVKEMRGI